MSQVTLIVAQGRSPNPAKRKLEEEIASAFVGQPGVRVVVMPHLYDLPPGGSGFGAIRAITGDMIVCDWLFPRAIHWVLDRNQVRGRLGETLLDEVDEDEDEDEDEEENDAEAEEKERVLATREQPARTIYPLNLNARPKSKEFIEEIRRLVAESRERAAAGLMQWLGGTPSGESLARYIDPTRDAKPGLSIIGNEEPANGHGASNGHAQNGNGHAVPAVPANGAASGDETAAELIRIEEAAARRWYPVIDFSRCTNCMECIDFCLFGVYGVDGAETILVEQPDNCRKGCPACSRVCPENAIIFPEHKTPAIAGSPLGSAGSFKIDLSKLFGAPDADAVDVAVQERDRELVAAGRDAVGESIGVIRREPEPPAAKPKDDLDRLIDQLDELEL